MKNVLFFYATPLDATHTRVINHAVITQPMPAAPVAGLVVTVLDPSKSWATNAASVSVGAGVSIENPAALGGAYVTNGTLALPSVNGASYSWIYLPSIPLWKLT